VVGFLDRNAVGAVGEQGHEGRGPTTRIGAGIQERFGSHSRDEMSIRLFLCEVSSNEMSIQANRLSLVLKS
jgi:hypothetical protein